VTVVGQVVSIQKQATNCVYLVDDGTGRIEARHWVDSTNEDEGSKWGGIEYAPLHPQNYILLEIPYRERRYVRVTGGLKNFGKKRYINATHIRDMKDPHETYFHILEAIAVTLMIDRGHVRCCLA
jgi:replication factor A2